MTLLEDTLQSVRPLDRTLEEKMHRLWDNIAHPLGSLGVLETLTSKIVGMTRDINYIADKKAWCVMSSDNGICEEGVSVIPQSVTVQLVWNMLNGITAAATMADFNHIDLKVVDCGLATDIEDERLICRKIAYGTKNFSKEPAMTKEEAIQALEVGIALGDEWFSQGYKMIATGELGIGNTSTSSAVLSVLAGLDVDETCGLGSGLESKMFENKKNVIRRGIELNRPNPSDPLDVLAKVGGFDIGAMAGVFLSGAKNHIPVVVDGYISSVSALLAKRLAPDSADYMIPSHLSKEPGAIYAMRELGLNPMMDLGMRLGEGTGCPFAMQIVDLAFHVFRNMGTFDGAKIDGSRLVDIRK